ncbi:MAG TPA: hypothetical protein VF398_12390 [bacterium]|jgi:NTP pyrophosphatase (non-canonical NTP hydrolase)
MNFEEIYRRDWHNFIKFHTEHAGLSNPLLLAGPDNYYGQKVKLFVVGQQTNSWYPSTKIDQDSGSIERLQKNYLEFELGLIYRSPFWDAIRRLEDILGIEENQILWSNLNRVDQNKMRPLKAIEEELADRFAWLPAEMHSAKPDLVVFLTVPQYDSNILTHFKNAQFNRVGAWPDRQLARVEHQALPKFSYRTYHPGYFKRSGQWEEMLEIFEGIRKQYQRDYKPKNF